MNFKHLKDRIVYIKEEIKNIENKKYITFADKIEINSLKYHLSDLYEQYYIG